MSVNTFYFEKTKNVIEEIQKSVIGKDEAINKILMAILARGHVLVEDIPGLGKTTLAIAFSKVLGLDFNRIQFTPDVMPSDVTGYSMYNRKTNDFEYKQGAVVCNLLLADEINRTSPKTQSALLEVMEEQAVTVDSVRYMIPDPFTVIATENPFGSAGTQKLPESQMDRFMIKISLGYPSIEDEINIMKYKKEVGREIPSSNVMTAAELVEIQDYINTISVDDSIYDYVARLAKATRENDNILQGISPRGSISTIAMAKACAFLNVRDFVMPSDIKSVFAYTASHRIVVDNSLRNSELTPENIIYDILKTTQAPTISFK